MTRTVWSFIPLINTFCAFPGCICQLLYSGSIAGVGGGESTVTHFPSEPSKAVAAFGSDQCSARSSPLLGSRQSAGAGTLGFALLICALSLSVPEPQGPTLAMCIRLGSSWPTACTRDWGGSKGDHLADLLVTQLKLRVVSWGYVLGVKQVPVLVLDPW